MNMRIRIEADKNQQELHIYRKRMINLQNIYLFIWYD